MKKISEKILIADDDANIVKVLKDRLQKKGFQVTGAYDGEECLNMITKESPSILLLDLKMPKVDGLKVLKELKKTNNSISTIVLTAYASIEKVVEAMKEGAYDFLSKPIDTAHLEVVIDKVVKRNSLEKKAQALQVKLHEKEKEIRHLRSEAGSECDFSSIIGTNDALQNVLSMVRKIVNQKSTVFIQGESGTGKELLARAIHDNSNRKNKNFIAVNCGAIPRELLESEFFGHVKGSFTGAHETKKGYFEQANGGTLFLDEIGDLNLDLQVKLLRVIQSEEILKVGSSQPIKTDVRLITATNKDLLEMVKEGTFRTDLFYRIHVIPLTMPPLRDYNEDIPLLINHFLKKLNKNIGGKIPKISDEAMSIFMNCSYPGNIRELENIIERTYFLSDHSIIRPDDLPIELRKSSGHAYDSSNADVSQITLKEASKTAQLDTEKNMILNTLKACNYNCSKTAKKLNISRTSLYNKMKKYNIQIEKH